MGPGHLCSLLLPAAPAIPPKQRIALGLRRVLRSSLSWGLGFHPAVAAGEASDRTLFTYEQAGGSLDV